MIIHITDQLIYQRITSLIRCSIGAFQIFRRFQSSRRYYNIFFHAGDPFHILKSVSHSITDCSFSLCGETFPDAVCCTQITDILRCHTENPYSICSCIFLFACKYTNQFQPCFLFALVIQLHAIRVHSQDRQIYFFLSHAFQCMVIRSDYCRNRCPDDCRKFRIQFCHCICKFCYQAVITSKDRIHVTKPRTEQCTFALKPSRLIKSTDISGTAAGITDNDNTTKFI